MYSVRKSDRDALSEYVGISNVFLSQQDLRKVHMNAEEYVFKYASNCISRSTTFGNKTYDKRINIMYTYLCENTSFNNATY